MQPEKIKQISFLSYFSSNDLVEKREKKMQIKESACNAAD